MKLRIVSKPFDGYMSPAAGFVRKMTKNSCCCCCGGGGWWWRRLSNLTLLDKKQKPLLHIIVVNLYRG